jgi:hypothetical protein
MSTNEELDSILNAFLTARTERDNYEAQAKKLQGQILALMDGGDLDEYANQQCKAKVIEPVRSVLDEEGLRGDLTKEQLDKITRTIIDPGMLEAAVKAKVIPLAIVLAHTNEVPNKAFVKVTKR